MGGGTGGMIGYKFDFVTLMRFEIGLIASSQYHKCDFLGIGVRTLQVVVVVVVACKFSKPVQVCDVSYDPQAGLVAGAEEVSEKVFEFIIAVGAPDSSDPDQ